MYNYVRCIHNSCVTWYKIMIEYFLNIKLNDKRGEATLCDAI